MVFYPDNIPRRDRALQLQNDISNLQTSAKEAKDAMDKEDKRMVPFINQILKNHQMSTFDELKNKLDGVLTDEQKKAYNDLVENSSKMSQGTDTALMAMSGILLTSGVLAKTIDIGNFLRAANIVTVFRGYTRAFITFVTEGVEAGLKAFRILQAGFKWATETMEETSTLARYAANSSRWLKILSVIGIFVDAFILAFDYFVQKKQKEALDKAITELYVGRILVKVFARMCDAIKTQDGMMIAYLILVGDDGTIDPDDQRAADKACASLFWS
ncbi:hypothetical protein EUX98_g50 [Antrodiella citrinella]|uniref:Uncharacterized protein n=1 Tax=Antrodiella citrinella TaxID=2447956 RepID=A0A4S4N6H3_9APHY|nr:hypothetical protein EUX98_g50 [Antrodiella citrinella]